MLNKTQLKKTYLPTILNVHDKNIMVNALIIRTLVPDGAVLSTAEPIPSEDGIAIVCRINLRTKRISILRDENDLISYSGVSLQQVPYSQYIIGQ